MPHTFTSQISAALAASQRNLPITNQRPAIDALLAQGKSVITSSTTVYIPGTDVVRGSTLEIVSFYDTPDEAEAAYAQLNPELVCHDDYSINLRHPQPVVQLFSLN